jgi:hypothetical protein
MAGQKSVLTWRVDLRYILEREGKSRVLTWLHTLCTYLLLICEFWQGLKRVCFCSFLLERIGRGNWFKNSCKQNCWSFLPLFFFFLIIFTNSFLLAWFYTTNSFYDCHLHIIIILTRMHLYLLFIFYSIIYHNAISMCFSHIQIIWIFKPLCLFFPVFFSLASSLVSNFVNCAKVAAISLLLLLS